MNETKEKIITIDVQGLMVLSFGEISTGGEYNKCTIHAPESDDNLHEFQIHDGLWNQPITEPCTLQVRGGNVIRTPEFELFSINLNQYLGPLKYHSGYTAKNKIEVFDGTFSYASEIVTPAEIRRGTSPPARADIGADADIVDRKRIAEAKRIVFKLEDGQELVFKNSRGVKIKTWNDSTRIVISNICFGINPICRNKNDFEIYYTKIFDVPKEKWVYPVRVPYYPPAFTLDQIDAFDTLFAQTVNLPCWDVYMGDPPTTP